MCISGGATPLECMRVWVSCSGAPIRRVRIPYSSRDRDRGAGTTRRGRCCWYRGATSARARPWSWPWGRRSAPTRAGAWTAPASPHRGSPTSRVRRRVRRLRIPRRVGRTLDICVSQCVRGADYAYPVWFAHWAHAYPVCAAHWAYAYPVWLAHWTCACPVRACVRIGHVRVPYAPAYAHRHDAPGGGGVPQRDALHRRPRLVPGRGGACVLVAVSVPLVRAYACALPIRAAHATFAHCCASMRIWPHFMSPFAMLAALCVTCEGAGTASRASFACRARAALCAPGASWTPSRSLSGGARTGRRPTPRATPRGSTVRRVPSSSPASRARRASGRTCAPSGACRKPLCLSECTRAWLSRMRAHARYANRYASRDPNVGTRASAARSVCR